MDNDNNKYTPTLRFTILERKASDGDIITKVIMQKGVNRIAATKKGISSNNPSEIAKNIEQLIRFQNGVEDTIQ